MLKYSLQASSQATERECRKLTEEVNSLTFRNNFLSKRVETLQDELEKSSRQHNHTKQSKKVQQ